TVQHDGPQDRPGSDPLPRPATIPPARRPELLLRPLGEQGRYVVKDPRTGSFFTFGEQEHFLLLQLDGERDAAAICRAFQGRFGDPLSEDDLSGSVERARRQGLPQQAGAPAAPPPGANDAAANAPPAAGQPEGPPPRPRQSILFWRKSLFDPDRF